ncbi:MAG: hypothetical protein HN667_00020 [Chloroflexi bacterium]|nr:hypothetical protein [Chloroflexota bacterium]MBT7832008.1 hypothetical protein [Chloroflexota bacterium]
MRDKPKFEREIGEILEKTDADDSDTARASDKSRQASKLKTFKPFTGTAA